MAEDMFDNGSFLRRRKRYKRPSFQGHWTSMLDPYSRKLLSQFTFQHMHGGASHHGVPSSAGHHSGPTHSTSHQPPPPHPSSHLHPGLLPHSMLMPGPTSHQASGSCNGGDISPPHQHPNTLPMSLNLPPPQNQIVPPHPMIAAAARAAQLANFPIRHPPPPCSVGFPGVSLPLNTATSIAKSPKRPSPETSPFVPRELPSSQMNGSLTPQFSSCLNSSRHDDIPTNIMSSSNTSITKSTMRASKGSGFTIDNIIGDQKRKPDSSNNNNTMVGRIESYVEEKRCNDALDIAGRPLIQTRMDENTISNCKDNVSDKELTKQVKLENEEDDDESSYRITDENDESHRVKDISQHKLHPTSNLPSFLQCAMLGKMVASSKNAIDSNESCQDMMEKSQHSDPTISDIHLPTSHYHTNSMVESWK